MIRVYSLRLPLIVLLFVLWFFCSTIAIETKFLMSFSIKPIFNRLKIKNKKGFYPVHLRITICRKTNYINTKIKVEREFWLGKQDKWIKESHPESFELNGQLQNKLSDINKYVQRLMLNNQDVTFELINKRYNLKVNNNNTFNDFANNYILSIKDLDPNTIKVYKAFQKHLNSYKPKVLFSELNENFLQGFKYYLQNTKGIKGAATKKYFDKLRVICADAVKKEIIEVNNNPFFKTDIKISVEKADRTYLEINEILALKNLVFKKDDVYLEKHRDFFLFQIYTGLYYVDIKKLKKANLHKNELGYYILDKRSKNNNKVIIPLYKFPFAQYIIDKYWNEDSEYVFKDTIEEQPYNRELKKIAKLASITKNITNKVGRHTNIQLWMSQGVERQFVSKFAGHSKEATTQVYYDISIHNIDSKVQMVNFEKLGI